MKTLILESSKCEHFANKTKLEKVEARLYFNEELVSCWGVIETAKHFCKPNHVRRQPLLCAHCKE